MSSPWNTTKNGKKKRHRTPIGKSPLLYYASHREVVEVVARKRSWWRYWYPVQRKEGWLWARSWWSYQPLRMQPSPEDLELMGRGFLCKHSVSETVYRESQGQIATFNHMGDGILDLVRAVIRKGRDDGSTYNSCQAEASLQKLSVVISFTLYLRILSRNGAYTQKPSNTIVP